ncbi:hypothetical protein ISN44_As12g038640 [Arabidopsis suecica]|uniref:Uncharacterized protein n=1 Tax=Arabidopsis suecica TaxID=45249 RepID=A0A8T1YRR0_ARASU|nr:hypothetical protein ISN44_As12g038640 [Arabidopsis suecica]
MHRDILQTFNPRCKLLERFPAIEVSKDKPETLILSNEYLKTNYQLRSIEIIERKHKKQKQSVIKPIDGEKDKAGQKHIWKLDLQDENRLSPLTELKDTGHKSESFGTANHRKKSGQQTPKTFYL